jgi:hypothetical protein
MFRAYTEPPVVYAVASEQICNAGGHRNEFGHSLEGMWLLVVAKHVQSVHGAAGFQTAGREQLCNLPESAAGLGPGRAHLYPHRGP